MQEEAILAVHRETVLCTKSTLKAYPGMYRRARNTGERKTGARKEGGAKRRRAARKTGEQKEGAWKTGTR